MTKKNWFKLVDNIFWMLIALFPLLAYVVICAGKGEFITLSALFDNLGLTINTNGLIYTTLNTVFGVGGGMLEIVASTGLIMYGTYFISVMLLHFIIDMLLIIVRWSQRLIDKTTKE